MVEAARRNDRVLDISFNHRRRGDVQALKKIIDAGPARPHLLREGRLAAARGHPGPRQLVHPSGHVRRRAADGHRRAHAGHGAAPARRAGGDRGHRGDVRGVRAPGQGWIGGYDGRVKTGAGSDGEFDVEDLSTAFLRLDGGGTLLLESSWAQWIPHDQCYVTVYGSDGGASIEWGGYPGPTYQRLNIWTEKDGVPAQLQPTVPPDGHHAEAVTNFVTQVRSGEFKGHDGSEALTRAIVVDACYASAGAGREIRLD